MAALDVTLAAFHGREAGMMRATESIDRYLNLFRLRLTPLATARGLSAMALAAWSRSIT